MDALLRRVYFILGSREPWHGFNDHICILEGS